MHAQKPTVGTLALLAAASLVAVVGPAASADAHAPARTESTTTHERGVVLECTGSIGGRPVYASVYENDAFTNVLQVLVGGGDDRVGGSRETTDGFVHGRHLRATMRVGGARAVVAGIARTVGDPVPVAEEHDDGGQHITVTGTHRAIDPDLTFTWKKRAAPLDCDTAFRYDLQVTREPAV